MRGEIRNVARALRANQTDAERVLWKHLRNRQLAGFKFKRQYWIEKYIVDFICLEHGLIVDIDGGQHATEQQVRRDNVRTGILNRRGLKVLRFWNTEVLDNILTNLKSLAARSPNNTEIE